MVAASGALAFMAIDAAVPSVTSQAFDFQEESLINDEAFIDSNGVRGTRARSISRVRPGLQHVGGTISFIPNAAEMKTLLTWAFGGTVSGSGTSGAPYLIPLGDSLSARYVMIDRVLKVFTYFGCQVDRITIKANRGEPVSVSIDVVGLTEGAVSGGVYTAGVPGAAGSFPAVTIDTATTPWTFMDLACVISSGGGDGLAIPGSPVTVNPNGFTLTINNSIDRERFFNSLTLTQAFAQDRSVMFTTELSYGDHSTLYGSGLAASGLNGVQVTATLTNGLSVLTFSMVRCVFPRNAPRVPGRKEIMFGISAQAFKASGGNLEVATSLSTS